ncbi:MAG: hypothetical protein GX129_06325 [Clostridiales bacterium]|jgi:uncharacterized membrane protein|nr:hypothetical protein [Clostridiales bacterium]
MAFCSNCGKQLDENTNVCSSCNAQAEQSASTDNNQGSTSQPNVFQKMNNTSDTTAEYDAKDIADNKVMALLSYLGILVLIPMFAAPNSKFTRFHVRQGFTLFLAYIGLFIVNFLLGMIKTTHYVWGVPYQATPGIVVFIGWLLGIPLFILSILGIINAYQGRAKELPIIGKFKILK